MTQKEAISATLDILVNVADNHSGNHGIMSAIGEFDANGTIYQIQLHLVSDKKIWIGENEVAFIDIVNSQIDKA